MENLEVKVKELSDENDRVKNENTKMLARIHTLEMEVCHCPCASKLSTTTFTMP